MSKKTGKAKTRKVSSTINFLLYEEINAMAINQGRTLSEMIERLLEKGLVQEKQP